MRTKRSKTRQPAEHLTLITPQTSRLLPAPLFSSTSSIIYSSSLTPPRPLPRLTWKVILLILLILHLFLIFLFPLSLLSIFSSLSSLYSPLLSVFFPSSLSFYLIFTSPISSFFLSSFSSSFHLYPLF